MPKLLAVLVVVGVTVLAAWEPLAACGDKFLLVGRGAKFRRAYAAIYPASILIYAPGRTGVAAAIAEPRLHSTLVLAGHHLAAVKDQATLAEALKSGRYDVVLADVADHGTLTGLAHQAPSQPTVLSVMYEPTKEEAEVLKQRYNCRLKAADKANRFLEVIDDSMKIRVKAGMARALKAK